ncbi:MAG: hypothetical protein NTY19_12630 [Planctomycetota bacterium]|nr:hypothetical protein [Planctomycetota bacterium]
MLKGLDSQLGTNDFLAFTGLDLVLAGPTEPVDPVLRLLHFEADVCGAALLPENPELVKVSSIPQATRIDQIRFTAHLRLARERSKTRAASVAEPWRCV